MSGENKVLAVAAWLCCGIGSAIMKFGQADFMKRTYTIGESIEFVFICVLGPVYPFAVGQMLVGFMCILGLFLGIICAEEWASTAKPVLAIKEFMARKAF